MSGSEEGSVDGWIWTNFDALVKKIPIESTLDRLVRDGWISPTSDDYQEIRSETRKSRNAGARRLLLAVLHLPVPAEVGEGALRRILADICPPDFPYRSVSRSYGSESERVSTGRLSSVSAPSTLSRRNKIFPLLSVAMSLAIFSAGILNLTEVERVRQARGIFRRSTSELPDGVAEVRLLLAKAIRDRAHESPFPWLDEEPKPGQRLYVNLVIVSKRQSGIGSKATSAGNPHPATEIPSLDIERLVAVNISHIWDREDSMSTAIRSRSSAGSTVESGTISRIFVRAEAGMGKTFTFARMVPYRWLHESSFWPHIDLVFVIRLGDLSLQRVNDLEDIFFNNIDASSTAKDEVMDYIRRNSERVLLICDGLDEGQHNLPLILRKVFVGDRLPGLRVIVTSRPSEAAAKLAKHFHRQLELLGLAENDLPSFIEKQMEGNSTDAENLLKRVKNRDFAGVKNVMGSPLVASLVCRLFRLNQVFSTSITELLEGIVLNLLRRTAEERFPHFLLAEDKECEQLLSLSRGPSSKLEKLARLALAGLKQMRFEFTRTEMSDIGEELLESGHLVRLTKTRSKLTQVDTVVFFHSTFMEFFAAYGLIKPCFSDLATPLQPEDVLEHRQAIVQCIADSLWKELPYSGACLKAECDGHDSKAAMVWFFAAGLIHPADDGRDFIEDAKSLNKGLSKETAPQHIEILCALQRKSIAAFQVCEGDEFVATAQLKDETEMANSSVENVTPEERDVIPASSLTGDKVEDGGELLCREDVYSYIDQTLDELPVNPQLNVLRQTLANRRFFPHTKLLEQMEVHDPANAFSKWQHGCLNVGISSLFAGVLLLIMCISWWTGVNCLSSYSNTELPHRINLVLIPCDFLCLLTVVCVTIINVRAQDYCDNFSILWEVFSICMTILSRLSLSQVLRKYSMIY